MAALFGKRITNDVMRWSDCRSSVRNVEQPRVLLDEWMNGLQPGDAWLRVAPVDHGWRQVRVRVALPIVRKQPSETGSETGSETKARALDVQFPKLPGPAEPSEQTARALPMSPLPALPAEPPECPPEVLERMGEDVRSKVERKWTSPRRELGPCLVWREGEATIKGAGGLYGRLYDPHLKRSDAAHLVVWRRCFPNKPIPRGWTVDHACYVTLCQRPDHLQGPVTRAENTRRRHRRPRISTGGSGPVDRFVIALFNSIWQPTFLARDLTLDELVAVLSDFDVLADKRHGRCWSPTEYADGVNRRGNAGVATVTALVFDLDRVAPDAKRLDNICWIGHTTWSHGPDSPRWRLVIPLAKPVGAASWSEVWYRARAAFCPEADPACKDPGRAYWLPSCRVSASPQSVYHPGPLLDSANLLGRPNASSDLPKASERMARNSLTPVDDRRRGNAYMTNVLANLRAAQPGGRNAALNAAAWTLGRWVAAGALGQREVEDALYATADVNGLAADDGARQTWATIRSGLAAGLRDPIDPQP